MAKTAKSVKGKPAETETQTPEEQRQEEQRPANVRELDVPTIHTSAFQAATTGTEVIVTLFTTKLLAPEGHEVPVGSLNRVVALLSLSPQAAKDLALSLAEIVDKHEAKYGILNTPFTQRQAAIAAAAADNGRRKKNH